jgi:hypothetical protein
MNHHDLKTDPALLRAIQEASVKKPTAEDLRKQRISFIYSSLHQASGITRDRIVKMLDDQEGKNFK